MKQQLTDGALVVLSLSTFIASLAISSVNIILPELMTSLHTSFHYVQWVMISYMLLLTSTLVLAGRVSDLFGRKRLFIVGLFIFTFSAVVCGFANTIWVLVCIRAMQGVGGAILIAVSMALVRDIFIGKKLAPAMGMIGSMSAMGTGIGPVLGGLIVDHLNWKVVFLMNLPFGLLIWRMAIKYLPNDQPIHFKKQMAMDYKGAFLLFVAILTYTLSMKLTGNGLGSENLLLSLFSLVFLLAFIVVERASNAPLIEFNLFKNTLLITSLISNFIVSIVVMSSLVVGPFYLIAALKLNSTEAGISMAASPATVAVMSFLVGRSLKHDHLGNVILIGLIIMTFAAINMSYINTDDGLIAYLSCLITMAVGYATFLSANNTLTMSAALSHTTGSISGVLNLSRNLGLLTGATLMSSIFASASELVDLNTEHIHRMELGLNSVYQCAVVLLMIAILMQAIAIRRHKVSRK